MNNLESKRIRVQTWLLRAPVLLAALLITVGTAFNSARLLFADAPRNAYEALEVIEAHRAAHGMPVYELGSDAHATRMYGALGPWITSWLFEWTGPSNITGRLLMLISSAILVGVVILVCRPSRLGWLLPVAIALLLGVDHRGGHYFTESRPDMIALLVSALAVIALYAGIERSRVAPVLLGSGLLVVGFFLKQISFVFAVVPLTAVLFRWQKPSLRELALASIPLAASLLTTLTLRVANPAIYHFMLVIPRLYRIHPERIFKYGWEFLVDSALFLLFLGEWAVCELGHGRKIDPRVRWFLALVAVALPWSVLAHAKVGGWPNSLLPGLFATAGFCVLRMPRIMGWIDDQARPWQARLAASALVALLILTSTYPRINRSVGLVAARAQLDVDYKAAIALVRELPGKVICPTDPTIPFYAKGYVGLNFWAERDARPDHGEYSQGSPEPVTREIQSADYVIDVQETEEETPITRLLPELGFERIGTPGLKTSCYRFYRRTADGAGRMLSTAR